MTNKNRKDVNFTYQMLHENEQALVSSITYCVYKTKLFFLFCLLGSYIVT